MGVPCDEKQYNHIQSLISNFCEIVLTTNDNLYRENEQNIEHFINDLSSEDISVLNLELVDSQVKVIVLNEIVKYIKKYTELSATYDFKKPFEFDSAGSYEKLCEHCKEYYQSTHQNNKLPPILDFTLHYIHDMSDHYRIFGFFYDYNSTVTKIKIIEELKLIVADIAKDETIKKIDSITNKVVEKKVDNSINRKMDKISEKISETSVTILGIFAGIVLTIVAGLFYSSSVIDNIKDANVFKFIGVASLVGLVCFGLISIMFYYIDKFRTKSDTKTKLPLITIIVSSILSVVIVASLVMYFQIPDNHTTNDSNKSDVNISANVNLSEVTTTATTTATTATTEITTAMQEITSNALLDSATQIE